MMIYQPGSSSDPSPLTQWWDPELLSHLPQPMNQANKACRELMKVSSMVYRFDF
jgi:hypothetical protein